MDKELVNKKIKVFLRNRFVFKGKCISKDDRFLVILDVVTGQNRYIALGEISDIEVLNNGN